MFSSLYLVGYFYLVTRSAICTLIRNENITIVVKTIVWGEYSPLEKLCLVEIHQLAKSLQGVVWDLGGENISLKL